MLAFAIERRWPDVFANSLEPGWVPTKMGGRGAPDDMDQAHRTQAWLAAGKPTYTNAALKIQGQNFRVYPDDLSCMRDWAEFLKSRFPLSYAAAQSGDIDLFFDGLAKGLYGAYAGPTSAAQAGEPQAEGERLVTGEDQVSAGGL